LKAWAIGDTEEIRSALRAGRIRRILLFRAARIGDLLFVTPSIRLLREQLPGVSLAFLTNGYSREVIAENPHLDEVFALPEGGLGAPFARRRLLADIRAKAFDLMICFSWKPRYAKLVRVVAPRFLHHRAAPVPDGAHLVERKAAVIRSLGIEGPLPWPEMFLSEEAERRAEAFVRANDLAGDRPVVGLQPGCYSTWRGRRRLKTAKKLWPVDRFARLASMLRDRLGARLVINCGSPKEASMGRDLLREIGGGACLIEGAGIGELGAVFRRLDLLITVVTGPMHMAAALGTRMVVLAGPTHLGLTGPYAPADLFTAIQKPLPCSPCRGGAVSVRCTDNRCMKAIAPEEVFEAARDQLARGDANGRRGAMGRS
jgi:ADP-heptose:LPS heptosyltransferase